MIELLPHADGVMLPVRAQAAARKNGVTGEQAGALKVSVSQAPEKGKANKAIIAELAAALDLRKSQIELIAGETSAQKRFLIRGVTPAELRARVQAAITEAE